MKSIKNGSLIAIMVTLVIHVLALLYFNTSSLEGSIHLKEEIALLELDYREKEIIEEKINKEEEIPTPENNESLKNLMKDIQDIRKKSRRNYSERQLESDLLKSIEKENQKTIEELRKNGKKGFDPSKFNKNPKPTKPINKPKDKNGGNSFSGDVTVTCNVPGRSCSTEKPTYNCKGGGEIYVEIKVDRLGSIKNASVIRSKSTTSDKCLIQNALSYAKNTTIINSDLKGDKIQKGFIIYNFISQ